MFFLCHSVIEASYSLIVMWRRLNFSFVQRKVSALAEDLVLNVIFLEV